MPLITVTDHEGNEMAMMEYKGKLYPPFPGIEANMDNIQKLQARDDDVILVAYPSSGTHWVWEMTNMLLSGMSERRNMHKIELFIEMTTQEKMDASQSPRVLNTHLTPDMLSPDLLSGKYKILFVLRNPKDQMVSMYNHVYSVNGIFKYDGTFNGYYDLAMRDQLFYGGWCEFHLQWEKYFRQNPHIPALTLYYEDLKEDIVHNIQKLADFLQVPSGDGPCKKIADECAFKNMKLEKEEHYPADRKKQWRDGQYKIFRKGMVGDWKNYFTVQQSETLDAEFQQKMRGSSLKIRFTI